MKRFSLIALLITFCFFSNGIAETDAILGKIDMNLPNTPTPMIEVNLNKSFFSLLINFTEDMAEYTEYAEMIEGVFVRSYDKAAGNLADITSHYQDTLKKEKWEDLVKVKDQLQVSLLFADAPGVVHGIFVSFIDEHNTTFVNVCGKIDFQKLGVLFGKIMESAPEIMKDFKFDGKFGSKK